MGSAIETFTPALKAATNKQYLIAIGVLTAVFTLVTLFSAFIPFATLAISFILAPLFVTACTTLAYYAFTEQSYTFEEIREIVSDEGIEVIKAFAIAQAANIAIQFALMLLLFLPLVLLSPSLMNSPEPGSLGAASLMVLGLVFVAYMLVALLISLVISLLDVTVLFTDNRGVDAIKYTLKLLKTYPVSLSGYLTLRSTLPLIPFVLGGVLVTVIFLANATFTGWYILVGLLVLPVWAYSIAAAFTYHAAYFLHLTDDERYTEFAPVNGKTDEN